MDEATGSCKKELFLFKLLCKLSPPKLIAESPNNSGGGVGKFFQNLIRGGRASRHHRGLLFKWSSVGNFPLVV